MKTLLVLCAGSRMIDGQPLFLMRHPDGKIIAEKIIEGIFPEEFTRIVYIILEEVDKKYDASIKIIEAVGNQYPVEILKLDKKTSGPAETVCYAIKDAGVEGEIVIRDSHSFIKLAEKMSGNFVVGLDLTKYEKNIDNLRSKSFVVLNEQRQILDIVEKRFCADVISVGLYGFKKASDFMMAYKNLSDFNYPIEKLYISHIISYLIGYSRRVFRCTETLEFEDWSTLNSWMRIQKRHGMYFLNLDTICEKDMHFESDIKYILKKASKNGACFVGFTVNDIDPVSLLEDYKKEEINMLHIITLCTSSNVRIIVSEKELLRKVVLEDS